MKASRIIRSNTHANKTFMASLVVGVVVVAISVLPTTHGFGIQPHKQSQTIIRSSQASSRSSFSFPRVDNPPRLVALQVAPNDSALSSASLTKTRNSNRRQNHPDTSLSSSTQTQVHDARPATNHNLPNGVRHSNEYLHVELPSSSSSSQISASLMEQESSSSSSSTTSSAEKQQEEKDVWFARLLLLGAAALYGTNFPLVKLMGETDLPTGLSTTLRFGLAALATSPWLFAPSRSPSTTTNKEEAASWTKDDNNNDEKSLSPALGAALLGFEVGLWNSVGYVAQAVGLETTLASKSAFLCSLAVVVVPFFNWLSGRQLTAREWTGAALALAGVAMLEMGGSSASDMLSSWSFGDYASMVQPIAFGMGFFRMESAMKKYPNEANRCTAAQLLAAVVGAALYCYFVEGTDTWDMAQLQNWLMDPTLLAFIAWTGIASTALSVYMETIALKTLSAAETTLILSTEPLWGAAFAALMIGEHFGTDAAVGGTMILAGCLYSNLGAKGIMSLVTRKRADQDNSYESEQEDKVLSGLSYTDRASRVLGLGTMIASTMGAWNSLTVGARVTILQMQETLEDLF